jgi:hypothetical protein
MKNKNKPARSNLTILRQICQHIPGHGTVKLARPHGIESRSFTPWSHVVAMLYGHLAGATMESFLPSFVLIYTAHQHEATRARELCVGLQEGEIVIFDKGYVDL